MYIKKIIPSGIKRLIKRILRQIPHVNEKLPYVDTQAPLPITHTKRLGLLLDLYCMNDKIAYEQTLEIFLTELESTLEDIVSEELDERRLRGLFSVLNSLCANFHFANRRFLEECGVLIDDNTYLIRVLSLLDEAISALEQHTSQYVRNTQDWLETPSDEYSLQRRTVANALNYLGREIYAMGHQKLLDQSFYEVVTGRFDILMASASFARIPFHNQNSEYFKALNDGYSQMSTWFEKKDLSVIEVLNIVKNQTLADELYPTYSRVANQFVAKGLLGRDEFPQAKSPSIAFECRREDHLRELLASKSLSSTGGLIIGIREFLSYENFTSISNKVNDLLSQNPPFSTKSKPNYAARRQDAEIISRELQVIAGYQEGCQKLSAQGLLKPRKSSNSYRTNRKILLLAFDQDRVLPSYLVPFLPGLQEKGYEFFNLADDAFVNEFVPKWPYSAALAPDFRNIIGCPKNNFEMFNDWEIRPAEGIISCNGVNYYQGLYERIARVLKVYTVDWNLPQTEVYFNLWVQQIDRLVYALEEVKKVAASSDMKLTLLSLQSHFAPYSALRTYAKHNADIFEHITMSSSYENWATNMGENYSSTVVLQNNNRYPAPSIPAFGNEEEFLKWFEEDFIKNQSEHEANAKSLVSMQRSGQNTPESDALLNSIKDAVAQKSGRVFCALGKIPYDLAVPYQGGPAHTSIKDWINHTIATLENSENILIVKPHPHELNYSISGRTNEGFVDLIQEKELSKNIILLPHRGINLQDLYDIVDVFLVWNGSSIAELGSMGLKILAADDWAVKNYPIDVLLPDNRKHYEDMLTGIVPIDMKPAFKAKSLAYLNYLTLAPFAIRSPFSSRSATNVRFNDSSLNIEMLDRKSILEMQNRYGHLIDRAMP